MLRRVPERVIFPPPVVHPPERRADGALQARRERVVRHLDRLGAAAALACLALVRREPVVARRRCRVAVVTHPSPLVALVRTRVGHAPAGRASDASLRRQPSCPACPPASRTRSEPSTCLRQRPS